MALVSLVSVWGRNWFYSRGRIERVETDETVEIANIDAFFMQVAENMVGWQKRLGEYPTLSAMPIFIDKLMLYRFCYVLLRYSADLSRA